jgi:hypothetical protein
MPELQKKYNIRHLSGDRSQSKIELFITPYERTQIEVAALTRVKTKVEYQKLIHLMHLRDSLVNRWSISRIFQSNIIAEGMVTPPSLYASFVDDKTGRPSQFQFYKDLSVEDLYQERIQSQIEGLSAQLKDLPLGSPAQYRKLITQFCESFGELKGFLSSDLEGVVANLIYVEETTLDRRVGQIIVESSFPQDDLRPSEIAKRIAEIAFHSRKSSLLTALLRRTKIDLAFTRGYLEANEEGYTTEAEIERAEEVTKLPPEDLKKADQVLDSFLVSIEQAWKTKLIDRIKKHYDTNLPKGKAAETNKRYAEFFNRILDDSIDGALGAKQVKNYNGARNKLRALPSDTAQSLKSAGVPVRTDCVSAGFGAAACTHQVNADAYLARLDAEGDLGMSWVIPWIPTQIADLFTKKIENLQKNDPSTWKVLKSASEDQVLMKEVAMFFEELNKAHQEAIASKQQQLDQKILDLSQSLAKKLKSNPNLDLKASQEFQKIQTLQKRIEEAGQTPEESVLTESMYQATAKKIFTAYIAKVATPPITPKPTPEPTDANAVGSRIRFPSRWDYISPRDATYVKPPVMPITTPIYLPGNALRAQKVIELGKLFSLLGFGWEFFNQFKYDKNLVQDAKAVPFVLIGGLLTKPYSSAAQRMGNVIKLSARKQKVSAISEISRTAAAQKFLGESIMASTYTRVPFLRIQAGEEEDAPTGLERLESAYSLGKGWNRDQAHQTFISLLKTAVQNDRSKVEDAALANPLQPAENETFKKIFRSQAHNRSLFVSSAGAAKNRVESWDQQLKSETRTSAEKWNDRIHKIAGVLFIASMVFLLWEFLPIIIPAVGGVISPASVVFSSFSVLGMSGSVIAGFLSGSNLLVQMFFMAMVVSQGQVAFFTLPAQLQYQKEIANSTIGLSSTSARIVAPAERASRENIQALQDEIRTAKIVTGVGAAVQLAFLPLQIKQLSRGFGYTGKVALGRLGQVNPELAESMKAYSLSDLVERFGYAKGSKMYFERYTSALAAAKPVRAVNGGATLVQAQQLLAESLATKLSNSVEVGALFEARLAFLKDKVLTLQKRAEKYFAITQGAKKKDLGETVKLYFGKEISTLGFKLNHPQVKVYIRSRVAQAMEAGEFSEIEYGTQKYLLKAFLLRLKAEKMMLEALHLRRAVDRLKALEAANGGAVGTHEIFTDYVGLQNLDHLDALFKWAVKHPDYQDNAFGELLRQARQASKDYKIIVDDISRLSKKDQATYEAMNGNADVVVNDDLTLKLGTGQTVDPSADEFFVVPGLGLGLDPQ